MPLVGALLFHRLYNRKVGWLVVLFPLFTRIYTSFRWLFGISEPTTVGKHLLLRSYNFEPSKLEDWTLHTAEETLAMKARVTCAPKETGVMFSKFEMLSKDGI